MHKKDLNEIRRRFHPEHHNITCIRGCYVNNQGEVIADFTRYLQGMAQEEAEKYLGIFKRTLSGTQGQNLLDIDFTPEQVMESREHQLLTALRESALKDDEIVEYFFQQVRENLVTEDHYLILLIHDGYDIPRRNQNDEKDAEFSTEVFHYILCSICPVKLTKPALAYDPASNNFRNKETDWIVGAPELGFMFPCFEERCANIYRALYYTRDTAVHHEELADVLFGSLLPMPAAAQKETFQAILQETLQEECSYEVMQAVHEQVLEKIEERKAEKNPEPLKIDKYEVKDALQECGVAPEKVAAFEEKFDQEFGVQAHVNAVNLVSPKQFEVRTPNVVIKVSPDRSDLVETRIIDGHPYILIRAEEGVEVNGVNVNIQQ